MVVEGEVRFALAKERLTHLKHDGLIWGGCNGDVSDLLRTALKSAGTCEGSIDAVGIHHIDHLPKSELLGCLPPWLLAAVPADRIFSVSHHLSHALSAFFLSPFEQAAVLVVDGGGGPFFDIKQHCDDHRLLSYSDDELILQELTPVSYQPNRERESFFSFRGSDITAHRRIIGSETYAGIAGHYGTITEVIFGDTLDSGKTMGLSTFGLPKENLSFLESVGDSSRAFRSAWARRADFSSYRQDVEAAKRVHGREYEKNVAAVTLAASVQQAFEEAMLEYVRWLKSVSGLSNLILVGGGALNCCSNRRISLEAGFDDLFVPACPGDDGIAIGCFFCSTGSWRWTSCIERGTAVLGRGYQ